MENSIETIWSKGFLREEDLSVPKLNKLYTRKSKLLIEKLKRTYRIDNRGLIPIALLSLLGFGYFGHVILGIYLALLMLALFFLNRKKLNELENNLINSNSYEYLFNYRESIKGMIKFYTRFMGLGLPVAGIIGYWLYFRNSDRFSEFLELEVLYIIGITVGIAAGFSIIGILAYRLSTKTVYGNLLKQLDEIIEDLRELRN